MFEIKDANQCSMDALRHAMQSAFSDYAVPISLSRETFEAMMIQRGLDRSASRIAVDDGNVVAIWLVSVREGKCYLISSGTVPTHRSRGLARKLAEACFDGLQDARIQSFQTEVLRNNTTAAGLYFSLGMTKVRDLDCYLLDARDDPVPPMREFHQTSWNALRSSAQKLRSWQPSWQNSDASLTALAERLMCLSYHDEAGLAAYAALSPQSGTVHQLAVRRDLRRGGVGGDLIRAIQTHLPGTQLRLINVDHSDAGFRALLARVGAQETIGQFELKMLLSG